MTLYRVGALTPTVVISFCQTSSRPKTTRGVRRNVCVVPGLHARFVELRLTGADQRRPTRGILGDRVVVRDLQPRTAEVRRVVEPVQIGAPGAARVLHQVGTIGHFEAAV